MSIGNVLTTALGIVRSLTPHCGTIIAIESNREEPGTRTRLARVHFVALVNVLQFKPGGLGTLGPDQLAWLEADLKGRSASTPIVVFAHMPLWTIYEPWGWGTGDGGRRRSAPPGPGAALRPRCSG